MLAGIHLSALVETAVWCSPLYSVNITSTLHSGAGDGPPLQCSWKTPWTEEPGRLQSMGSKRVRHDWATSLSLFTFVHWSRKWQPAPGFLPGESQGRGSLVGSQSRTRLKWLSSSSILHSENKPDSVWSIIFFILSVFFDYCSVFTRDIILPFLFLGEQKCQWTGYTTNIKKGCDWILFP